MRLTKISGMVIGLTGFLVAATCALGDTMRITFPGYTNRTEALTDFPVLVVFSNTMSSGFSFDRFATTNGADLRFVSSPSDPTPLDYEIESWNTNAGQACYVWVRVPSLPANGSGSILATWGNPANSTPPPCTTNGAVWTNGYVSVWHLQESSGTRYDSTAARLAGTPTNGVSALSSGKVGPACSLNGSDGSYITASAAAFPSGSSPRTLEVWFKKTGSSMGREIMGWGNNSSGGRFGLWVDSEASQTKLGVESGGAWTRFAWTLDSNWHHMAAVLPPGQSDLSAVKIYYDGLDASPSGSGAITTTTNEFKMGGVAGVTYSTFDGALDEARVSSVARSADWMWATHMAIASNAAFSSYDTAQKLTVINSGVSVGPSAAWLSGTLVSTNAPQTTWGVVWGTNDPGQTLNGWLGGGSRTIGQANGEGVVASNLVEGLQPFTSYCFRYWASNAVTGVVMAEPATVFVPSAARSMPIALAGYSNRTETLTDFPVLVVLSNDTARGLSFANFATTNGTDLRFVGSVADASSLNYEIESWNTNAGQACYVWVQVPRIPANGSGVIWAKWGNVADNGQLPCTTNGATWSNGYVSVWHLQETSGTRYDSTAAHLPGTPSGGVSALGTGKVGPAALFDGNISSYIMASAASFPTGSAQRTLEVWFRKTSTRSDGQDIVGWGDNGGVSRRFAFLAANISGMKLGVEICNYWTGFPWTLDTGVWHHMAAVLPPGQSDLSAVKMYYDGVDAGASGSGPITTVTNEFKIGGTPGVTFSTFDGALDEVRVSSVARSADWTWACWMNQGSNEAFSSRGRVASTESPVLRIVANTGVTVNPHCAWLGGTLLSTCGVATTWGVIWGTNDPGRTLNGWLGGGRKTFGLATSETMTTNCLAVDLEPYRTYCFRYWASNSCGISVADPATLFVPSPARSMAIALPGYTNRTETLTDFPVLVVFSNNVGGSGFTFGGFTTANGTDLRFVNSVSNGGTSLDYEIESWNTNPGQASYVWVRVPTLPGDGSGLIWAKWGNPADSSQLPCTTNGAVWTNGYVAVWHLNEGSGTRYDSTASHLAGTPSGSLSALTQGIAGPACSFAGGYIAASAAAFPTGASQRTLETWFKKSGSGVDQEIVSWGTNPGTYQRFGFWVANDPSLNLGLENCGYWTRFPWTLDTANWHNLTAVLPAGQSTLAGVTMYYDGVDAGATSASPTSPIDTATNEFKIGGMAAAGGTYAFVGALDEVRISNVARSSNWLWACWLNQGSNEMFNSFGSVAGAVDLPFRGTTLMFR